MIDGSTAICVLGMSRSGTSLTARVLDLAGVYLGPSDELLGGGFRQLPESDRARAREANPEGFWEHYRLMRLNERILRRLGGSWRDPPPLPPGWERSAELREERGEARDLLAETFSDCRVWAWKDPRNSLTLPFWRALVPKMRCVICLRPPLEVAASLEKRDGIPLETGFSLWLTYVASALVNTSDCPRLLMPYASYFEDAVEAGTRLACFVGLEEAFDDAVKQARLKEAIDPSLWRNRSAEGTGSELPLEVASLDLTASLLASAQPDGLSRSLRRAADAYALRLLDAHRAAVQPL